MMDKGHLLVDMPKHHKKPHILLSIELAPEEPSRPFTLLRLLVCGLGAFPKEGRDRERGIDSYRGAHVHVQLGICEVCGESQAGREGERRCLRLRPSKHIMHQQCSVILEVASQVP
jgi:hypothetical protein